MSSVKNFTTAREWVDFYTREAERLIRRGGLGSSRQLALKRRLDVFASETLDKSIEELEESARFGISTFLSGIATLAPVAGSVGQKLVSKAGLWLVIRKLVKQWGISDRQEVAKFYRDALEKTGDLPKPSSWLSSLVDRQLDSSLEENMKALALEYWNDEDVAARIHHDVAAEFGNAVADQVDADVADILPLIGDAIKVYNAWEGTSDMLRKAAMSVKENALPVHRQAFVEVAICKAL
jgi:hypothetical protein